MDPCTSGRQHVIATPSRQHHFTGVRGVWRKASAQGSPVRTTPLAALQACSTRMHQQARSSGVPALSASRQPLLASTFHVGALCRAWPIKQQQQHGVGGGDARCAVKPNATPTNKTGDVSTAAFASADSYPEASAVRDEVVDYLEHAATTDASAAAAAAASSSRSSSTDDADAPLHKPRFLKWLPTGEDELKAINYSINLSLLLLFGAAALTKIVTAGSDQWGVLSLWEVVAAIPGQNWELYEAAVESNPMFTKACISGVVYSLGDLTAQTYEGRSLDDFDRGRVLRSGICGFVAHGPLSHLYYENLDAFFNGVLRVDPDSWYQPLAKVAIDQTVWSLFWNSAYYVLLGALKFESPEVIAQTVKSSWWDLLKAGWRLWPFAHVITYGVIPVQHRLLWVDSVELVWVTILSLYGQQQRERLAEAAAAAGVEGTPITQVASALPGADGQGGDAAEEILRGIRAEREVVVDDGRGHRTVVDIKQVYDEQAAARKKEAGEAAAAASATASAEH